jgi:hypothetical protein
VSVIQIDTDGQKESTQITREGGGREHLIRTFSRLPALSNKSLFSSAVSSKKDPFLVLGESVESPTCHVERTNANFKNARKANPIKNTQRKYTAPQIYCEHFARHPLHTQVHRHTYQLVHIYTSLLVSIGLCIGGVSDVCPCIPGFVLDLRIPVGRGVVGFDDGTCRHIQSILAMINVVYH